MVATAALIPGLASLLIPAEGAAISARPSRDPRHRILRPASAESADHRRRSPTWSPPPRSACLPPATVTELVRTPAGDILPSGLSPAAELLPGLHIPGGGALVVPLRRALVTVSTPLAVLRVVLPRSLSALAGRHLFWCLPRSILLLMFVFRLTSTSTSPRPQSQPPHA